MFRYKGQIISGFEVYAPPDAPLSVHEFAVNGRKSPFRTWPADARTRALRMLAELLPSPPLRSRTH